MPKITPHLWFDTQAKEATEFYTSILPNSKIDNVSVIHDTPSGDCDIVNFTVCGQPFMAISAGPYFKINPSISFHLKFKNKEELTAIWEKLSKDGKELMPLDKYPFSEWYSWVEDKYGVSWQLILVTDREIHQQLMPALTFVGDIYGKTEEAMEFYTSIFDNSKILSVMRYGSGEEPDKEGNVKYAEFTLDGMEFGAMESAYDHKFSFNEAVSLMIPCQDQKEIDYYWEKLSADPKAEQCGWLKDKFGVSWQVTYAKMDELMKKNPEKVTAAFLQMKKFDVADLEKAAND